MENKPRNRVGKEPPSLPGPPQPEQNSEVRAGGCRGPPCPHGGAPCGLTHHPFRRRHGAGAGSSQGEAEGEAGGGE